MPELRPLSAADARRICADNYTKSLSYLKAGALGDPWRTSSSLHASVSGSASQPYEASAGPKEDGSFWGRCSCPAARRQPLCKHSAALIVAWAERPEGFVVKAEPERVDGAPKLETEARRIRAPKTDRRALLAEGLDRAETLLVDLCSQGFLSATGEQAEMIGSLAELLEAHKLRRLARQVSQIRDVAASARRESQGFDERAWARLLADSWFILTATRKALERGDGADRTELEELVGKTWLEKDLQRLRDLEMVELAYRTELLSTGFRVETSYLVSVADGTIYTEKQIVPTKLKDVPKKRSYSLPLRVASAGVYPGFPPQRVKLIETAESASSEDLWDRIVAQAEMSATALRQRLSQVTASLVAPQELFSLFSPASFLVQGEAIYLVDGDGRQLPVGSERRSGLFVLGAALVRGSVGALFCRLRFTDRAMEAEPLSVILREGSFGERLIRLTA